VQHFVQTNCRPVELFEAKIRDRIKEVWGELAIPSIMTSSKPRGRLEEMWSSPELRVVDRFARALVAGKYPTVAAAVGSCRAALARVRPDHARSVPATLTRLTIRARAMGRVTRFRRWTAAEDRLTGDLARAVIARRYPSAAMAIPDFRQALTRAGLPDRRSNKAIQTHIINRTFALGRRVWKDKWTDAETRVAERFGRALARGKYRHAGAAVADCQRALAAAGLPARHPKGGVRDKIRRCAHRAGMANRVPRWSPLEKSIADRYAQAVARGEYSDARRAAGDCCRELERTGLATRRTESAVSDQLLARCLAAGWKSKDARLTPGEQRTVDRFARKIASGRIAFAQEALSPCRRELARLRAPVKRTDRAILHHLISRARTFGWQSGWHRWTTPELRLMRRYARALGQGKYPSSFAAARACRDAMKKAGFESRHSKQTLSTKIRELTPGWAQRKVRWRPEEDRLVADFARAILEGRYAGIPAALPACAAALGQLATRAADAPSPRPRHTLESVTARLWEAAFRLGPRSRGRWRKSENRVIDRYARAVIRHRYPSVLQAARVCWAAVNRLDARAVAPGLAGRARRVTRPLVTVHAKLLKRTWELGRARRPQRLWSKEERRISGKWARRLGLHKLGRLRMSCLTMAGIMQGELGRQGYHRTRSACETEILARYRSGIT